jgi:hypothetical protein
MARVIACRPYYSDVPAFSMPPTDGSFQKRSYCSVRRPSEIFPGYLSYFFNECGIRVIEYAGSLARLSICVWATLYHVALHNNRTGHPRFWGAHVSTAVGVGGTGGTEDVCRCQPVENA